MNQCEADRLAGIRIPQQPSCVGSIETGQRIRVFFVREEVPLQGGRQAGEPEGAIDFIKGVSKPSFPITVTVNTHE